MPTRRILNLTITPWSPGLKATWTVEQVRSALRAHRHGDFAQSSRLVESMLEDDELPGVLEKRVDAVLESDFELRVPEDVSNKQLAKRVRDGISPRWQEIVPDDELNEISRSYRMTGIGLGWLDWKLTPSFWLPRLRALPVEFLRWDEEQRKFFYNAREGEFEVTPGDGKWVLLTDGPRGWLRGSVRALAVTWIAKAWALRDWNRFNERHGLPLIKVKVPAIADEGDKEDFFEDVKALQGEAHALLPTHLDEEGAAFDLDLLEAKDTSWETFPRLVEYCNRRFQIHFQGSHLATELDKNGSRAAAETHKGVEREKASADAKKIGQGLRAQVLRHVAAYNFAEGAVDVAPCPFWDTLPTEDLGERATAQKTFGEALHALKNASYEIKNIDALAEEYGLELEKREEPQMPAPGAPPKPGAPGAAPPPQKQQKLASGDEADGFLDGQLYADALTERGTKAGARALRPDLEVLLSAVEEAEDYEDLRTRLRNAFPKLEPERLSGLVEKAMVLAELAGRHAVQQDL